MGIAAKHGHTHRNEGFMNKKRLYVSKKDRKTWAWAYALIAPTVILILILNIWPILQTVWYSFHKLKGLGQPTFIGLDNYSKALGDKELWNTLKNTLLYAVVTVPVGVLLSLMTAVFLNTSIKAKGLFRVLYFLPVISAPAAVAMVWRWLYNSEYGIINYFLSLIGIKGPNWIGDGHYLIIAIMIVGIWSLIGYNMVILLAGLQDIPKTFYEAAEIDGAGAVRKFCNITLPLVTPTLFFVTLTTMISAFQVFDVVYMMIGKDNPAKRQAETIVYMFFDFTFVQNNKGYGSTIATILLIIILLLTAVQFKAQKKWVHYQ